MKKFTVRQIFKMAREQAKEDPRIKRVEVVRFYDLATKRLGKKPYYRILPEGA